MCRYCWVLSCFVLVFDRVMFPQEGRLEAEMVISIQGSGKVC